MANENPILNQLRNLRVQVAQSSAANAARLEIVEQQERAKREGLERNTGPQSLARNMGRALPKYLVPGNLGDINKVVWPFWFTAQAPELPAAVGGTQVQASSTITVTQEACFVLMSITKTVFVKTLGPVEYTAVDADQPGAAGKTPGLSMIMTDAQSRRIFMSNPYNLDNMGSSRFPTEMPPMLFLPNSTIEMQLFNTNTVNTYVPWITFFGYRVRVEDAQQLLSLVTG
jgi:hypothetical protein